MPTYEYECKTCGHHFDKFQGINDEPETECPQCQGEVHRLIGTGGGMIIKGSPSAAPTNSIACGREQTCCGRQERCDKPPCGS